MEGEKWEVMGRRGWNEEKITLSKRDRDETGTMSQVLTATAKAA